MVNILWVDDGIELFTGLRAYLSLEADLSVNAVASYDEGHSELLKRQTDLFIFDLILMRDHGHASLKRRLGMELAKVAVANNVRKFIAYSVLSELEIQRSWDDAIPAAGIEGERPQLRICRKGNTPVTTVIANVRSLLAAKAANGKEIG